MEPDKKKTFKHTSSLLFNSIDFTQIYTRQKEHFKELEEKKDDNPLWKHTQLHHSHLDPQFQFQAEKFCSTLMEKAIFEGVFISNCPSTPGHMMNSKTECKQGKVARVVLFRGLGQ